MYTMNTIMRRGQGGFTLMELLAALTILGILAAIAIPNYTAYVNRGKRAAAKVDLMAAAAQLERNYTTNGCYNFTTVAECRAQAGTAPALTATSPTEGRAHHAITVDYSASATGQAFTLSATPCGTAGTCPAGSEAYTDADCGTLTMAHTGLRTSSGSAPLETCWRR
jgi:type IV pilus assembly protein PilE